MAKQTIERLIDDLDGSEATETVAFGVDGLAYVIDVNDKHASDLRTKLTPFIEAARTVRPAGRVPTRGGSRPAPDRERGAHIREWALSEGVELPGRGRIARVVEEAYAIRDGQALRAAFGFEEEEVEEKPKRRRRAAEATFSEA
jgi:hypothetical protein